MPPPYGYVPPPIQTNTGSAGAFESYPTYSYATPGALTGTPSATPSAAPSAAPPVALPAALVSPTTDYSISYGHSTDYGKETKFDKEKFIANEISKLPYVPNEEDIRQLSELADAYESDMIIKELENDKKKFLDKLDEKEKYEKKRKNHCESEEYHKKRKTRSRSPSVKRRFESIPKRNGRNIELRKIYCIGDAKDKPILTSPVRENTFSNKYSTRAFPDGYDLDFDQHLNFCALISKKSKYIKVRELLTSYVSKYHDISRIENILKHFVVLDCQFSHSDDKILHIQSRMFGSDQCYSHFRSRERRSHGHVLNSSNYTIKEARKFCCSYDFILDSMSLNEISIRVCCFCKRAETSVMLYSKRKLEEDLTKDFTCSNCYRNMREETKKKNYDPTRTHKTYRTYNHRNYDQDFNFYENRQKSPITIPKKKEEKEHLKDDDKKNTELLVDLEKKYKEFLKEIQKMEKK